MISQIKKTDKKSDTERCHVEYVPLKTMGMVSALMKLINKYAKKLMKNSGK